MLVLSSRFLNWFVSSLFVEISNARVGILGCYHRTGVLCPCQLVHVKFGISSWRGSRVDGRSYLQSGAINGSEVNGIIHPKLELESSRFTFD
ncbi:hypothetical protein Tco_1531609 [Tanacetum coccineum]